MPVKRQVSSDSYVFETKEAHPVQVLRWTEQRDFISFTGSSARVALPTGSVVVELSATENCYINFGDSTVNASTTIASDGSRLFLSGVQTVPVPYDVNGDPFTHIAAIQDGTAGILQVEKLA